MGHVIDDLTFMYVLSLLTWCANSQLQASDYIIRVTAECPRYPNGTARVQVLTDVPNSYPYITCYDDWVYDLDHVDASTWTSDVVFQSDDEAHECVFNRLEHSNTYVVNVYVPLSLGPILGEEKSHVITCSYDAHSAYNSAPLVTDLSTKPIEELLENMVPVSTSDVEMTVVDVAGRRLTGRIRLGRNIQLRARLVDNYEKETSLQAVSCVAIGSSSMYNILIGGCGDDTILPKEKGFITNGREAISPYFRSFRLSGSRSLSFDCTFTICRANCDGSSCVMKRSKQKRGLTSDSKFDTYQKFKVRTPRLSYHRNPDVGKTSAGGIATISNRTHFRHLDELSSQDTEWGMLGQIGHTFLFLTIASMGFLLLLMAGSVCAISRMTRSLSRLRKDLEVNRKQYILTHNTKVVSDT